MKTLRSYAALTLILIGTAGPLRASTRQDAEAAIKAKDYSRAFKLFERAAQEGDPASQYRLGNAYVNGGVANKDPKLAADWYAKAAKQGYAPAQTMLGRLALKQKDYSRAIGWFNAAASSGSAEAKDYLGYCHLFGRGTAKDEKRAAALFAEAAKQGNLDAQYELGILSLNGMGMRKDAAGGLKWIRAAASAGNPDARRFLKNLEERGKPKGSLAGVKRFWTSQRSKVMGGLLLVTAAIMGLLAWRTRKNERPLGRHAAV